jgi:hypothetical protein
LEVERGHAQKGETTMKRLTFLEYVMLAILIFGVLLFIVGLDKASAHAWEVQGFKHMTESSGGIIGSRFCDDGTSVWSIDHDGDREVDICKRVFFDHEVFHYKEFLPIDNECTCEEN